MIAQKPLVIGGMHSSPVGDCWRACIASILERPCNEVPHFAQDCPKSEDMCEYTRRWLIPQGLNLFEDCLNRHWTLAQILKWYGDLCPGIPIILSGHPVGGPEDEAHAVIMMDGAIVYDPGKCGLDGPAQCRPDHPGESSWWVHVICLSHPLKPRETFP